MKPQQSLNSSIFRFICFCTLIPTLSLAQKQSVNHPILLKNEKGKEITIEPGRRLIATLSDESKKKGRFKGFDGEHLAIGEDSVAVADVTQISIFPVFSQIAGSLSVGSGAVSAATGTALIMVAVLYGDGGSNQALEFLMGVILAGVAVPPLLLGLALLKETNDYKLKGENAWTVVSR